MAARSQTLEPPPQVFSRILQGSFMRNGQQNHGRPVYVKDCLVLSREWGEWVMETIIGEYRGTTIGIRSPKPLNPKP